MKRNLILTALLLYTSLTALSQVDKGNLLAGGAVRFTANKYSTEVGDTKNASLTLNPSVGYFVANRLAAGLRAGVHTSKSTWWSGSQNRYHSYSLGPFARYYFLPGGERVNLFTEASYLLMKTTSKDPYNQMTQEAQGYTVMAGPALFLNPNVALQFTVGYSMTKWKEQSRIHELQSGVGLEIHLGKGRNKEEGRAQ